MTSNMARISLFPKCFRATLPRWPRASVRTKRQKSAKLGHDCDQAPAHLRPRAGRGLPLRCTMRRARAARGLGAQPARRLGRALLQGEAARCGCDRLGPARSDAARVDRGGARRRAIRPSLRRLRAAADALGAGILELHALGGAGRELASICSSGARAGPAQSDLAAHAVFSYCTSTGQPSRPAARWGRQHLHQAPGVARAVGTAVHRQLQARAEACARERDRASLRRRCENRCRRRNCRVAPCLGSRAGDPL